MPPHTDCRHIWLLIQIHTQSFAHSLTCSLVRSHNSKHFGSGARFNFVRSDERIHFLHIRILYSLSLFLYHAFMCYNLQQLDNRFMHIAHFIRVPPALHLSPVSYTTTSSADTRRQPFSEMVVCSRFQCARILYYTVQLRLDSADS